MARVGVVGAGGWGKNHLRVLCGLGALAAFCDIDPAKVGLYEREYRVRGYTSLDDFLRRERLDAVTVCTPTFTHYAVARKAMEAGLHTLVEKPLAYNSAEGERLVKLAEKAGVILAVGYIERFNPPVAELKDILSSGRLGEPMLLEFHRESRWAGVRDVGVVLDTSVHDIDTARWLFDEEPRTVYARVGMLTGEHEDFAAITLGFGERRTAFITSNWITPKKVRQLTAVCAGGIARVDFVARELIIEGQQGNPRRRRYRQEPLVLELKSFLKCVEKGGKPLVTGRDGVNTTKIAEAALKSSRFDREIRLQL